MNPEIWALHSDTEWMWVMGKPSFDVPGVTASRMKREPSRDCWSTMVTIGGYDFTLEVTGLEITTLSKDTDTPKRIKKLVYPTKPKDNDSAFVGFDNLPEPEFGTGWDDFDWSK